MKKLIIALLVALPIHLFSMEQESIYAQLPVELQANIILESLLVNITDIIKSSSGITPALKTVFASIQEYQRTDKLFHAEIRFSKDLILQHIGIQLKRKFNEDKHLKEFNSLLLEAVNKNKIDLVKVALFSDANVDTLKLYEGIPLMQAAQEGHVEIVRLLLEFNANVNSVDENRYTALMWAEKNEYTKTAELLKEASLRQQ